LKSDQLRTLFTGRSLIEFDELHSTNTFAQQLLNTETANDGTVVWTMTQTNGRGYATNSWEVEPGQNLTFSIIYKPSFLKVTDQFYLNKVICLGIRDTLIDFFNIDVYIKWPNDIVVNEKKICGVLIENNVSGNFLQYAICGIGLNVNQKNFDNLPNATSIFNITSQKKDLRSLLYNLCENIEARYLQLRNGDSEKLNEEYISSLYRRGEEHFFKCNEKKFLGEIIGITKAGKLVVRDGKKLKDFGFKEIEYL
jgi:BirA family transcriptional regulator, biotin operon repressor / biotin---[acetyl-CoA-carboxylase] ligase